jgi:hypothetical protein
MNFCTSCGQPREAGARFCTSCGAPFVAGAGDEPAPVPPEPQPTAEQPWQAPQETWAPQQEPWAPQQEAPTPPHGTPPAQQDTWATPHETPPVQQDTWAAPQDAPTAQQETWAAEPGAGFATQPGAETGIGAAAADDPFAHFFRDGPGEPTQAQGGYAGPQGGYARQRGGYAGPQGGYAGAPGPAYGETAVSQPPPYAGAAPPGEQPPRRGRARVIILVAGVMLVLAAGGVGAWAALGGKGHPRAAASHRPHPATSAPSSSPQPSTSTSPPASSPSSSGLVAAAPGVTGQSDEPAVLAFLNRYFTAINTHNYQQYYGLLDTQQQRGITERQFRTGYRATRDSRTTLVTLGPAGGGTVAASVTFTSHQPAAGSPSHSSCTDWDTTLYLRHQGGSYVIGAPPASYHASYHAC